MIPWQVAVISTHVTDCLTINNKKGEMNDNVYVLFSMCKQPAVTAVPSRSMRQTT